MQTVLEWLALGVDFTHAALMIFWGLGLPLLFWHRFPRLSRAYVWYCLTFVGVSVASQLLLGECFLTSLSRYLWQSAGGYREDVPFVVTCVNAVAGIRPSARAAVLAWQVAIAVSSLAVLWYWGKSGGHKGRTGPVQRSRRSARSW